MSLTKKFLIAIITSILAVACVNVFAFYFLYSSYTKLYLYDKNQQREFITKAYIDSILEKQAEFDVENFSAGVGLEFQELLELNDGVIPLNTNKNINVVVQYLNSFGVSPQFIEEVIPQNKFADVIDSFSNKSSVEYKYITKLRDGIILINIFTLGGIILVVVLFLQKTVSPIRKITQQIREFNLHSSSRLNFQTDVQYQNTVDEVGMLLEAIKKLSKKIEVQNDIKTKLLADISHELKTPITAIQTYLEGISDGVIKLDEKNLQAITSEMNRLIELVNKIMDFEQFDRKVFTIKKEKFGAVKVLKQIAETHKKRLYEKKQRVKVVGKEELELEADKNLFTQLVHNLIGNFLKYAGVKTLLTINVTPRYICFSDDGKGVKSSKIPFLMEKFYQGNDEKTGDIKTRGIGVGLSIVKKIIESHGWEYEIITDENKGFSLKVCIK